MAVDVHGAGGGVGDAGEALHLKAGALDDGIAQHQNLRQHAQHQTDGDEGAPAQTGADGADDRVGGEHADEDTRRRQNGAGGEDGGEGAVQRLHDGLFGGHRVL